MSAAAVTLKIDTSLLPLAIEAFGMMADGAVHTLSSRDGKTLVLPRELADLFRAVLDSGLTSGEAFLVMREKEISPEDAATILGVSRPLVYSRMDSGLLPFRQVGSHRRLAIKDVLDHKAKMNRKSDIIRQMYEELDDDGPAPSR